MMTRQRKKEDFVQEKPYKPKFIFCSRSSAHPFLDIDY